MIDLNRIYALEMMRKRRITGDTSAKFYITTTAENQTLTINGLTVSAATDVDWGDGASNSYTGAGTRTHTYAAIGTYEVRILQPENVTAFDLRDGKVSTLNSADIKGMTNTTSLYIWNTTSPNVVINTADFVSWSITTIYLQNLTNATGTIDTGNFSGWTNASGLLCRNMPKCTFVVTPGGISTKKSLASVYFDGNGLSQIQVDLLLWELYQATLISTYLAPKNAYFTGNAAPSGTLQAAQVCPVSAATPGQEIRHELLNDGCGSGLIKWVTVLTP